MRLTSLRLTNFRNFADQRLDFPARGVAIVGDNGQGKTNLLEGIYYLEIFRSFRGAADEQLVRFSEEVFRIEGRVASEGRDGVVAAAYDRKQKKKKVFINGVEPPRLGDGLGQIGVVVFSPSDVEIVGGGPALRRRFLDIVLSLTEPRYLEHLQRYRQILLRRNSLLRRGAPHPEVAAWDPGLVQTGARLVAARDAWIRAHAAAFGAHVRAIAATDDALLEYESSVTIDRAGTGPEAIPELFTEQLARVREREVRRGSTLVGPHRDDLRIRATTATGGDYIDLRTFGSGGQQRTAAVALRMIEAETLHERLGSEPIILLDDVFAELDVGRSRRILEWVEAEENAQVILTAPKSADFELRGESLPLWQISAGTVSAL